MKCSECESDLVLVPFLSGDDEEVDFALFCPICDRFEPRFPPVDKDDPVVSD